MEPNNYYSNEEEKYSDVINSLKNLPKVNAEPNFEFKLMTRINNRNFEPNIPERKFFFGRTLVPAAAVGFAVLILFFSLNDSGVSVENPFLADPPARVDYSSVKVDTIELQNSSAGLMASEQNKISANESQPKSSEMVRVVVEPSDAVTVEELELPFDDTNSLDLDSYVKGNRSIAAPPLNRGALVGGGKASQFDGFLIRERPSEETIASHKARLDSVKKAQKEQQK